MSPAASARTGPRRVFLHIGLPKTGTTYLQQILWSNRSALRAAGLYLPGFGHREHLWAALDLQERPRLVRRHPDAPGSWSRLVEEALSQRDDVLLTHEFLCGASQRQAARALADFPECEVHLIVTARDAASVVSAGWQESVKNGGTVDLDTILAGKPAGGPEFSMLTWDLAGVLERWTPGVPAERVHVLVMPGQGEPRDQHWRNFADVLGVDPNGVDLPEDAVNAALGIVQIETLRVVNRFLPPYSALERGTWIRGYLAEDLLARQTRERGGVPAQYLERFAAMDEAARHLITERGFDVRGDLVAMSEASTAASGRLPETVSAEEIRDAAGRLVADLVADLRASTDDVVPRSDRSD